MWPKIYLLKSVATESCSLPLPGRGSRTDALRPHSSNNWSWVLSMCLLTQCWQVGVAGFAGLSLVLLQTYQLAADLPQPASSLLIHGPGSWLLFCQHVVVAPRHPLQLFGHGQVIQRFACRSAGVCLSSLSCRDGERDTPSIVTSSTTLTRRKL